MDMTVTAVESYPKGKGRVAIYLNDEFAFVLYKGELSQYGIEVGTVVDDELYERILDETLCKRAKKRAMNLLKSMDRTEADVRGKLREGGYPEEAVDAAIDYVKSYHYIDDLRYAGEYIRIRSDSMSRKMIANKLRAKGITSSVIEEAFKNHDESCEEDGIHNEEELIRKLIARKCHFGPGQSEYEVRQKLFTYLYGKGFSISLIERVYNEYMDEMS